MLTTLEMSESLFSEKMYFLFSVSIVYLHYAVYFF